MAKLVMILVEGQTEEKFVNAVLRDHLGYRDKSISVTVVCTKVKQGRREHRGGNQYSHIKRDIHRLLGSKWDVLTTLFDFFRIAKDFPGHKSMPRNSTCFDRVAHLEREFGQDIGDRRFIPNLVLHEFEALLFSAPRGIAEVLSGGAHVPGFEPGELKEFENKAGVLEEMAGEYRSPEEINQRDQWNPAARIARVYPGYDKVARGPQIASHIGLPAIRAKCRHFDAWLTRLENL